MLLNLAHGCVDLGPDVGDFGQREQKVETCLGREVEDAFGVIGGGLIDAVAAPGRCGGTFELGALNGKADLSKTQEDEAKDRT